MIVKHNLLAYNADRRLGVVTGKIAKSTEKLSSGYQINRAADDAAGLSISEKMRKQIRGLTQASDNCEDGISLCQVADGALNETQEILQRINVLAVQAANGTNSATDRENINQEVQQLLDEIDRIAECTSFNEFIFPLKQRTHVEEMVYPVKTISMEDVDFNDIKLPETYYDNATNTYVGYCPFEKNDSFDTLRLSAVIDDVDNEYPIDNFDLIYGDGGTSYSSIRLYDINAYLVSRPVTYTEIRMADFTVLPDEYSYDEATKTWSRSFVYNTNISGTDVELKLRQKVQIDDADPIMIKGDGSNILKIQAGASSSRADQIYIKLVNATTKGLGIDKINIRNEEEATKCIGKIAEAINKVSKYRSYFGAIQNRLEHTVKNLDNVVENTTAAESQIRDTDMAKEMVLYSNNNILQQVGQSMLAQANQSNQGVLNLIQ